jgi:hypothetical protein
MGKEEYEKWMRDALVCLMCKYSEEQARIVLDWFEQIRSRAERDLVGDAFVDAFCDNLPVLHFSVYDSLMARMWIYAPYILEQAGKLGMRKISDCVLTCLEVRNGHAQCVKKCKYRAD